MHAWLGRRTPQDWMPWIALTAQCLHRPIPAARRYGVVEPGMQVDLPVVVY